MLEATTKMLLKMTWGEIIQHSYNEKCDRCNTIILNFLNVLLATLNFIFTMIGKLIKKIKGIGKLISIYTMVNKLITVVIIIGKLINK